MIIFALQIYKGDGLIPHNTVDPHDELSADGTAVSPDNKAKLKSSSSASSSSSNPDELENGVRPTHKAKHVNDVEGEAKVRLPKEVLAPFHDEKLLEDLGKRESDQSKQLHGFFATLALCHTVLAAVDEDGTIEYKAQSPDEAAL